MLFYVFLLQSENATPSHGFLRVFGERQRALSDVIESAVELTEHLTLQSHARYLIIIFENFEPDSSTAPS
jgi:hypothetical protein